MLLFTYLKHFSTQFTSSFFRLSKMTKRCRPGLEVNLQDPDCVEFINTLYSIFGEYKFRLLSKLYTNDYFTQTNIEQLVHTPSQLKLLAYSIQHLSKETVAE